MDLVEIKKEMDHSNQDFGSLRVAGEGGVGS